MPDLQITHQANGWDLALVDGDLVMVTEFGADVAQRVIYHVMTWLGESPYDRSVGVPYEDVIFGYEPVPGAAALLTDQIQRVEGVAEVIGTPTYELDDRTLSIGIVIRAIDSDAPIPIALDISAVLAGAGLA